jgi:hypothetical protein
LLYDGACKLFATKFARHIEAGAERRNRTSDCSASRRAPATAWGDWINFGSEFHLDGIELTGWGDREEWGVWSVTDRPSLRIGPLRGPAGTLRLTMAVRGAVFAPHPVQTVDVILNGQAIESWRFTLGGDGEESARVLILPGTAVDEDGYLDLAFHVAQPVSLLATGISADSRELGLGIESILLECIA